MHVLFSVGRGCLLTPLLLVHCHWVVVVYEPHGHVVTSVGLCTWLDTAGCICLFVVVTLAVVVCSACHRVHPSQLCLLHSSRVKQKQTRAWTAQDCMESKHKCAATAVASCLWHKSQSTLAMAGRPFAVWAMRNGKHVTHLFLLLKG